MNEQFAHLHTHTEFSMLDGHARHKPLMAEVARLGQPAVAMTDHGNMYGAYSFFHAAKAAGVKPIIGNELYVAPKRRAHKAPVFWGQDGKQHRDADGESGDVSGRGAYTHLTAWARNAAGLRAMFELTSRASIEGQFPKGKGRADRELFAEVIAKYGQHIIASTGCPGSEVQTRLRLGQYEQAKEAAGFYQELLGKENFFLEVMDHGLAVERRTREDLLRLGRELGLRPLATNDAHYVHEADAPGHDALLCAGVGKNLDDAKRFRFDGTGYFIKPAAQMRALFDAQVPGACDNTLLIAEMVEPYDEVFAHHDRMPSVIVPDGHTQESWLAHLVDDGLRARYPQEQQAAARARVDYELSLIGPQGFAGYFLAVYDLCRFMRERGIRFAPRGSAAGSAVVYALFIADLEPIGLDLMFERFINPDRVSPPDIDLDIDQQRREEVIRYILDTYGSDHVAQIVTFSRIAARGALKTAAKIHGLPYAVGERASKAVPPDIAGFGMSLVDCFNPEHERYEEAAELRRLQADDPEVAQTIEKAHDFAGIVSTTGKHACGVIIAAQPLLGQVPIMLSQGDPAKGKPDSLIAGFEYPDLESMGLQKMDLLGLRNWTVVDRTIADVLAATGERIELDTRFDDPAVYRMLARGEALGLFQIEGSGMRSLLRAMKPTTFEDIMASVALYRPGPMGMDSHTKYCRRKNGLEEPESIHPELTDVLQDILGVTYGLCAYQEQVIKIAQAVAGYSPGRADLLRKAMGKKKKEILDKEYVPFRDGMLERDYSQAAVDALWETLKPFAMYGFGRAHSACYAALAYWTAWLKHHHPVPYMANLLESVGDDKAKLAIYLAECRRMGIAVAPPDINASAAAFAPEDTRIRFGLSAIRDVGDGVVEAILAGRAGRPYESFVDFLDRVPGAACTTKAVAGLIEAGAFDTFGAPRRALLAIHADAVKAASTTKKNERDGAFTLFSTIENSQPVLGLAGVAVDPALKEWDRKLLLDLERKRLGLYVSGHPLDAAAEVLAANRDTALVELLEREEFTGDVHLAGMITDLQKRMTKASDMMATFALEDLDTAVRCVVFPRTYSIIGHQLADDAVLSVKGRLSLYDGQPNVMVDRILVLPLDDGERPVTMQVPYSRVTAPLVADLKRILRRFPGPRPTRLRMLRPGGATGFALPGFEVQPGPEFLAEVKALLGRDAVRL